jgi:hypothetical protein
VTPESINDEEFVQPRPSSWSAALSQLPGLASEQADSLPRLAGKARDVTSELEEDLDGSDEPLQ